MLPSHWVMDGSDKNVTLAVPRVRRFYGLHRDGEKKKDFVKNKRVSGSLLSYRQLAKRSLFLLFLLFFKKCPVFFPFNS